MTRQQLKFGDEKIQATTIASSGDVPMDSARIIAHGEEIAIVARLKLSEYGIKDLDGPTTLVHKTKLTKATIVADELVEDILDSHIEATTGQLHLLSTAGEGRRAARLFIDERGRQIDECGYSVDHDDQHDTEAFALLGEDHLKAVREIVADATNFDVADYLGAMEDEFIRVGALAIAAVEHVRRRLNEHLEAEARAEADRAAAARAEEAAKNGEVADAMAVHSDDAGDDREQREVGEGELEEAGA